jgi:hypothetical protein
MESIIVIKPKRLPDLTDADVAYCKVVAGIRRVCNRARDAKSQMSLGRIVDNNGEELGIIAEYAFCKHFNLYFDATFGGKDKGYDCVLNGQKIDIKGISNPRLNLVAFIKKERLSDIYVLVSVEQEKVNIQGWVASEDLCRPENVKDLGYGERYFMERKKLNQWSKGNG